MKTEVDRELVKQVNMCLSELSPDKKRNFLFVGSSKDSVLLIDKKALGSDKETAAKKKAGATKCVRGVCFGATDPDEGKRLVFLVKAVESGLDRNLKAAIKENAGISCKVEVRVATDDEMAEVNDKTSDKAPSGKVTQAQKDVINKARARKLLTSIGRRMGAWMAKDAQKTNPILQKITPLLAKVEELMNQGQPKKALELLLKIDPMVPASAPQEKDDLSARYRAKRQEASDLLKWFADAASRFGALNDEAKKQYQEAGRQARLLQFSGAVQTLQSLLDQLVPIRQRMEATTKLLHLVQNLADPAYPESFIVAYDSDIDAAMRKPLGAVSAALHACEEKMREGQIERDRVVEAMKAVQALLKQATGKIDSTRLATFKADYDTAVDKAEVNFGGCYDALTDLDARVRAALRQTEDKAHQGPDDRKARLGQSIESFRNNLKVVAKMHPEIAKQYEAALDKIVDLAGKDLDKAEASLGQAVTLFTKALDQGRTAQRARRARQRKARRAVIQVTQPQQPPPDKYETLVEWSKRIDDGKLLEKVVVGKQIAAGGYGTVNVLEPEQGEDVPPMVIKVPSGQGSEEDLQKEMVRYRQVGDHPNILKCLGMREVDGKRGLILERVQGKQMDKFTQNLNTKLAGGELAPDEYWSTIRYMMTKSLGALDHLHQTGLAHNDLKPGNIMIDEATGELKVIDLGTLNLLSTKVEGVDSPMYRAPEDYQKHQSSPQTDAFAMGATAYASMKEKEAFHYGDQEGMNSGFLYEVGQTVEAYGQIQDEEPALQLEDEQHSSKEDPSRVSMRNQFSDFMNRLLHPDPSHRLSPKQALEHPFLRDATMSDDQVKAVIKRMGQAPLDDDA